MIREVMIFLQGHGISTLFAVRIYKKYGDKAIEMVTQDPYRLANDFYGIGFFSADKVALSIGLAPDSDERIIAAMRHILAASREQGHCYLKSEQIRTAVEELLTLDLGDRFAIILALMEKRNQLKVRTLNSTNGEAELCYYSKTLYYDEEKVASWVKSLHAPIEIDTQKVTDWITRYCSSHRITLSQEQAEAVAQVVHHRFSVLTGGPGCGKTTTTLVIVRLLEAMHQKVLLAAPTGRAAQRMGEVIGREAKTLHRLLEATKAMYQGGSVTVNEVIHAQLGVLDAEPPVALAVALVGPGDDDAVVARGDPGLRVF